MDNYMIKCRLNILMAEKDIRSVTELERRLKIRNLNISRQSLHKIYHSIALDNTRLDTILKLLTFFNCKLEDLFIWDSK